MSLRRAVGSSWSWVRRFTGRVMPRFINHTLTQRIKQRTRSASRGALSQRHTQLRFPDGAGNCSVDGFVPVGGASVIRGLCDDDDGVDSELKSTVPFALFITHRAAVSRWTSSRPVYGFGFYAGEPAAGQRNTPLIIRVACHVTLGRIIPSPPPPPILLPLTLFLPPPPPSPPVQSAVRSSASWTGCQFFCISSRRVFAYHARRCYRVRVTI